jgi:AcrR family transcriptional regulator
MNHLEDDVPAVGAAHTRPRVEGEREEQILDTTVRLLVDLGYDRLTLDAVAADAHASKATLYRRWRGKAELVVDAVTRAKRCPEPVDVDSGSLRGDLMAVACNAGGLTDDVPLSVLAGLMSAMHHDADLERAFRERFLAPRIDVLDAVFERARKRGEIEAGVDIQLLFDVLPGMVLHRRLIMGGSVDDDFIARIIDGVLLPAAHRTEPVSRRSTTNPEREL